ncbi:MAG: sarcosine oxidase subunit delta [Hyphomicrobiales bacterium]|nr:sarcosine oxidase subunit delta [Hyphomicrobiales bacterium]
MKLMNCPLNGHRNISEFICGGEVRSEPDPNACSDAEWVDYIFMHDNQPGVLREWWCHVPTAYWFIAERNTLTDEIVRTYPASEVFKARIDYAKPDEADNKDKST